MNAIKRLIWPWLFLTVAIFGCGGGDGNPGRCSGSPVYCAEYAPSSAIGSAAQSGLFSVSGTGDAVFDIPVGVTRVHIQATYTGSTSNFIVAMAGSTAVNVIIGSTHDPVAFDGTYLLAGGGAVQITKSAGVAWTFTEVPVTSVAVTSSMFLKVGSNDAVFDIPARQTKIRIQGTYAGATSSFIVNIAGSNVVNAIIGTSKSPSSFDATYLLPTGGTVAITFSNGVDWTFTEVP